ncbi:putative inorganic phosphate cotransporter [Cydia pomonella]|uniref:putative inorganic phosphate cotransporter n=1 Tax=Cydia pomonella TaxID=82600 RepID=UPI002ADE4997|nr:putative inorganic phosphate cotransporter [Cydia pomonella]XP_061713313.1 putative inorganic phosphate cotransporter [Cydia pomonella]XP_061713314.1 putative inorganic phosphate cotransporter [Cydia pomonella]XP_061713315.1 putative inorganic phosphate cotransporter [Cydia pomonella]
MLTGWRLALSKLFLIPQRYVFAIMALLAIANAYTMRVCLNMAITQMVRKTTAVEGDPHYDPNACPSDSITETIVSGNTTADTFFQSENILFEWSEATQGLLLSAFYYGYVITHIPGGMLAERYGGKWVLGLGLLSTAVCTFVTPVVTKMGGAPALFALRVIEGFGEGPTMPALMSMVSRWAPKTERARIGSIVFGGAQIGNIAGTFFSGLVLSDGVWDNVFYLFGGFGLVWFALWTVLCYSTPNTHPYISDKEKKYLNENVASLISTAEHELDPVPWKALLRSVPLWALIIAGIGHDWGYFTMVTDLPKYMTDVLKFNIKAAGVLSSVPYIAMWIAAFFFGLLCDFCVKRGYHSILNARKIYTTIAATGPGICIIMASYSGCDTTLAVFWFVAAMTLMGAYYSGMKINALDITPNYAGTTTAMVNGIAAISAIITPYLIGLLTPQSTLAQWRIAFWVCLAVLVITNIIYLIWAQGEPQWWDDVKKYGYPPNWKHGPLPTKKKDSEAPTSESKEKQKD